MNLLLRYVGETLLNVTLCPGSAGDSDQSLTCRCDRVVKPIDPFGYHMVGCKVGANAIRLHDEVVFTLANLFTSIGIEPVVEPVRLFDADPD